MPYEILDHEADAGIRGLGHTLEEAFAEGARAMFALQVDLERVEPEEEVKVECQADTLEGLFVAWLGELLLQRDLTGLVFSQFEVKLEQQEGESYRLSGRAWGERLDPERHLPKVEVKAATYSGLKIGKTDDHYYAQCVVDL